MNTTELNDTIADLEDTTKKLQDHARGLVSLVKGLPCDSSELLKLLDELADAEQDCNEHFTRFEDERGIDYDKQSETCRSDWSRCHNRRMSAVARVTRFAQALRAGSAEAA